MESVTRKGGLLYPMLVIAAIAVIVFSVTGIATMMGWLPSALSGRNSAAKAEQPAPRTAIGQQRFAPAHPAPDASRPDANRAPSPAAACTNCGVIESIRAVEVKGQSSWLGAAGGAVVGGLLGTQIGNGRGRTAASVVGAGAGAYAGNEIEKNMNKSVRYRVRVRMEDGSHRTFHEAKQPSYAVGQTVRVTDRGIRPAG
jgi:outer membrane lipoprotein SlyB